MIVRSCKTIWVRDTGSEKDVEQKIKEIFDWSDTVGLQYMYASGEHLRKATLKDVENAES